MKLENFLNQLNLEFSDYLLNEGKWLGGDFKLILDKDGLIKHEVVRMLPEQIQSKINYFVESCSI